jgi:hypothetical protein
MTLDEIPLLETGQATGVKKGYRYRHYLSRV